MSPWSTRPVRRVHWRLLGATTYAHGSASSGFFCVRHASPPQILPDTSLNDGGPALAGAAGLVQIRSPQSVAAAVATQMPPNTCNHRSAEVAAAAQTRRVGMSFSEFDSEWLTRGNHSVTIKVGLPDFNEFRRVPVMALFIRNER